MPPPATAVQAFERTNFFYGLLLDAERLRKDHAFFNGKRWMLNRLTVGSGVVCGFDVRSVAGPPRQWFIDAGVAIDTLGRELVVADSRPFDPAQPTDEQGRPSGAPLTTGTVEICLAYAEVPSDLVPVLVPDCDGHGECAASTIREDVVVIVRPAAAASAPAGCTLPEFPVPPATGLHELIARRLRTSCPKPGADPCVPIARIDLATSAIDADTGRPLAYSNQLLYELVVCLAQHIAGAAPRLLRYVSGDGQSAAAGSALPNPLVIELTDALHNPVAGETVAFTVASGGGTVASATAVTAADGRASTTWTLGPAAGDQQVITTADDAAFAVTFRATSV
jgi:hypothetical protein